MKPFDRCRQGARSRGSSRYTGTYMVDGESLTYEQIAERLGCSRKVAKYRLIYARSLGHVTWEMLRR